MGPNSFACLGEFCLCFGSSSRLGGSGQLKAQQAYCQGFWMLRVPQLALRKAHLRTSSYGGVDLCDVSGQVCLLHLLRSSAVHSVLAAASSPQFLGGVWTPSCLQGWFFPAPHSLLLAKSEFSPHWAASASTPSLEKICSQNVVILFCHVKSHSRAPPLRALHTP